MEPIEKINGNIYRVNDRSVWLFADDLDIWIIRGLTGLSITVWNREGDDNPIDAIYVQEKIYAQ